MIPLLILASVPVAALAGTLIGLLGRLSSRAPVSDDTDAEMVEPVRYTEDERQAALAELAPYDPDNPEHVAARTEQEWDAEWRMFWASHQDTAARGEALLAGVLDGFAPGWDTAVCDRGRCELCPRDFDEARERAGVFVAGSAPVDWSTAEYAVVPA